MPHSELCTCISYPSGCFPGLSRPWGPGGARREQRCQWRGSRDHLGVGVGLGLCHTRCLLLTLRGLIPLLSPSALLGTVRFSFLSSVSFVAIRSRNPGWNAQARFQEESPEDLLPHSPAERAGAYFTPEQTGRCEPNSTWLPVQGTGLRMHVSPRLEIILFFF